MRRFASIVLCFALLSTACASTKPLAPSAPNLRIGEHVYNCSSHDIALTARFPEINLVFVDHLPNPAVLGTLAQYVTIYDGFDLTVLRNTVVIAVESVLNHGVPLSEVISHEAIHVEQSTRYPSWPVFRAAYEQGGDGPFEAEAFSRQRELPVLAMLGNRRDPPRVTVVYY